MREKMKNDWEADLPMCHKPTRRVTASLRPQTSVDLATLEETLNALLGSVVTGATHATAGALEAFQVILTIDGQDRGSPVVRSRDTIGRFLHSFLRYAHYPNYLVRLEFVGPGRIRL